MGPSPPSSSLEARRRMQANRRRDTGPELALRRELHRRGLRYRVDYPILPRRRADIVFPRARVAVFVDGCYWHGCPEHATSSKANAEFWQSKISRNQERDLETNELLSAAGWVVLRFWEHESVDAAADRAEQAVQARQRVAPSSDTVRAPHRP